MILYDTPTYVCIIGTKFWILSDSNDMFLHHYISFDTARDVTDKFPRGCNLWKWNVSVTVVVTHAILIYREQNSSPRFSHTISYSLRRFASMTIMDVHSPFLRLLFTSPQREERMGARYYLFTTEWVHNVHFTTRSYPQHKSIVKLFNEGPLFMWP